MDIPDQIISVLKGKEGQELSAQNIKDAVIEKFGTNESSIIPSDFCYNRINKGSREPQMFERTGNGKYKFLGVNYPYNGKIYARPKGSKEDIEVGLCINGKRTFNKFPSEDEKHWLQNEEDSVFFPEGKEAYQIHRTKERNGILPKKKKDLALTKTGTLECEVCGFDFFKTYGDRGMGFIECHHNKPISEMNDEQQVSLRDMALLCSNCHRMIHRFRPWLSVEELRSLIKPGKTNFSD